MTIMMTITINNFGYCIYSDMACADTTKPTGHLASCYHIVISYLIQVSIGLCSYLIVVTTIYLYQLTMTNSVGLFSL